MSFGSVHLTYSTPTFTSVFLVYFDMLTVM